MKSFSRFIITFLVVTGVIALTTTLLDVKLSYDDFWDYHGVLFLIFITLFPRLTLIFSSVPFGGIFWWLGLIFFPRYLIAMLATFAYWHRDPILVVAAWLVALGGESSEKYVVVRRARKNSGGGRGFHNAKWVN